MDNSLQLIIDLSSINKINLVLFLESFCQHNSNYLQHYPGQISVQRAILTVSKQKAKWKESTEAFIEEAVIRRELADNFCFYNENYDSLNGASDWARKTLQDHVKDKREYIYTREQFETARTHDQLWNAAQVKRVLNRTEG